MKHNFNHDAESLSDAIGINTAYTLHKFNSLMDDIKDEDVHNYTYSEAVEILVNNFNQIELAFICLLLDETPLIDGLN